MNVTLPSEMETALGSQMRTQAARSALGESLVGEMGQRMEQGDIDWSQMPGVTGGDAARQAAEDAIYGRYASRLDPQWRQRQEQMSTRLANQGLTPGSEAYTNAMRDLNQAQNDAYQTALNESVMGGGQEASRQYQLESANRGRGIQEAYQQMYGPINAMNAALQGQQVQMPQFPGFSTVGTAQAPQYMQAANLGYQGQLNQMAQQQAGLQSLLGGFGSFLPFMM